MPINSRATSVHLLARLRGKKALAEYEKIVSSSAENKPTLPRTLNREGQLITGGWMAPLVFRTLGDKDGTPARDHRSGSAQRHPER